MSKAERFKGWLRGVRSRPPSRTTSPFFTEPSTKGNGTADTADHSFETLKVSGAQVTIVQSENASLQSSSPPDPAPSSPPADNPSTSVLEPQKDATPEEDTTINLWIEARKLLDDADQIVFNFPDDTVKGQDILSQLQSYAAEKQRIAAEKAWKLDFGGRRIVLRDVANKIAVWINAFKQVGDAVAGLDPAHAALPWAAIKLLLQVVLADQEQAGQILIGVEQITCLMARCNVYERLYLDPSDTPTGSSALALSDLRKAILQLYAKVLSFLAFYLRCLGETAPRRALKSVIKPEELSDVLADLGRWESKVELAAPVCENQLNHLARHSNTTNFETLRGLLHRQIQRSDHDMVRLWKKLDDDERCKMFQWISDIPYETDHYNARRGRVYGTGDWLLINPSYVSWRNQITSTLLWLNGIPGAGKTKLSSKVVDSLLDELGKGVENMALGYFYCDRNRDDHRDPVAVLRSIVRQISAPRDESTIIACVEHAYMERKRSGFAKGRLTSEECQDLLLDLVDSYSQTTVVIDGLDECEPQMRHILMDVLDTMLARSSRRLKIFIASRKDQDLKDRYLAGLEVTANDNQADIEKFVLDQMERSDFFKKKLSTHVRQEVLRTFHDKSQGMFQWAALHIGELLELKRNKDILNYLDKLPRGLEAAYDKIYQSICTQPGSKRDVAFATFKLLMCSWRPLSPFELVIAVTQDPESDFTIDDDVDIDYVLSACQNFVVVADGQPNRHSTHAEAPATNSPRAERSHLPDGGYKAVNVSDAKEAEISSRLKSHLRSSVCRFSHLSVREYLETHHWTVSEANTFAACICLRTLLCLQLDGAPGIEFSDADEVLDGTTPILKVVRLERSSRQQLIWIDADGQGSKMGVPESNARIFVEDNESKFRPPPFLCFVEFVPDETADHSSSASSRGFDTYIKGHRGTALEAWVEYAASTWSLHTRRATTIKKTDPTLDPLVLQFLGDPGAASAQYHAWSIFNHRALDLSMEQPELLGQFHRKTFNQLALCPTTSTDFGCAYLGLGTILRSRLEAGLTDVNEPNELGDSLLLLAARGSHYETCAALLSHGANPNYFDNGEVTPLQYAAKNKRDDLVNLLLDHNADPNLVAKEITAYTRTPLIEVVSRGQIDTVRRLLERGADVTLGKGDDMYRAIEIAATRGDREIVALLLNKYSTVDERTTDLHIWEALLAACASKNPNSTAVIELLINRVNPADTTAMHSAAVNRNLEAAKALSDLGVGVDIRAPTWTWSGKYKYNAMIERQRAMIMVAAGEQHIPPVSSSEFWEEGDTPLLALLKHHKKEGRLEVATQLIAWGADVNVQDFWGRTPLRLAIETGDGNMEKMVEHLLSKEADPEIKDRAGVSALQAAQSTREPNRKLIEMLGGDHGVDEASVELVGEVPSAAT